MPSRGSLICVRTTDATSSRTRSACRRTFAGSVISNTSAAKRPAGGLAAGRGPEDLTNALTVPAPRPWGRIEKPGLLVVVTVQPTAHGQQLKLGAARDRALAGVEHLADVPLLRGDDGDADLGPPGQVERPHLGDGDLELTQICDQRPHVRALGLE